MKDRFIEKIARLNWAMNSSLDISWDMLPPDIQDWWRGIAEQILTTKLDGRYSLEVVDNEAELPKPRLSSEALDAVEVRGVLPHVATAISHALAIQSRSIQLDMFQANWRKVVTDA